MSELGDRLDASAQRLWRQHNLSWGLFRAIDFVCAAALAMEVIFLLVGLVWRYALHQPLIWIDELASMLLLWIAMLGSVCALHRGEHLRLTTPLATASESLRKLSNAVESTSILALGLFLAVYGYVHVEDEAMMTSPGLGISNAWRASAMIVGATLIAWIGFSRCARSFKQAPAFTSACVLSWAIAFLAAFTSLSLANLGNWNLVIFFAILLPVLMAFSVPIAFAFAIAAIGYLAFASDVPLSIVVGRMDGAMSHVMLLAIPLFVFLGKLMEITGMASALVRFIALLVGHIRGGLSYALIGAIYVVSGISGAKTADMAAVAPVLFPEMKRRGAQEGDMVSLLAASAVMSETIPPSLVLIAIAATVGLSVADLFKAGLLPACFAALALIVLVYWRSRADHPAVVERPSSALVLGALWSALPALCLPFLIRAAVVEGVATATEVAVIGVVYTLVAGAAFYRQLDLRRLYPILLETAVISAALLLILGAANAMAWALTQSGFADTVAGILANAPGGRYGFLAISIGVFIAFGSVLEGLPAIALFAPLLFPIAKQFGINEIHYSMVTILAMGLGLYMPPFGVGYYSACAIGRIDPTTGARHVWSYLGVLLVAVIVVALFPGI